MDEERDLVEPSEEEFGFVGDLCPYPSAAEERDLWRRYSKLRRINEIFGSETITNEISGVDGAICNIVEDISKSLDLVALLRGLSGLDGLGDKIIEDSNSTTSTMIELYRLIQNSGRKNDSKAIPEGRTFYRLQDLFGFIFVEMLNNIAFGRGNPSLVDRVVKATNSDQVDVRTRIYRLAIDRELLPKSIMKLFDPKTLIVNLPQLVRGISPDKFSRSVLKECQSFINNSRVDGKAAFNRIIETHLRLSAKSARVFSSRDSTLPIEDLFQEGSLGLMKAAEHFNPAYGHRFMSYAPYWIHQAIARAVADSGRVIRVPVHMVETIDRFLSISQRLAQEFGREPTSREIGQRMGISPEKVREIAKAAELPISLELPLDEEEDRSLVDFIEDHNEPSPPDAALKQLLKEQIDEVLSSLTHREQRVLVLRFGLEDGRSRTLEEVGQEFNVTRERIRQIEAKALKKLRHPSRSRKLKDYL